VGDVIHNLLDEVNARYQSLLSMLQARGEVRLINPSDIEEAGLEIFVSFKGGQLSRLDPYTHSGGERSTTVMAFLLALQQNILSPFRAVDEFDLHMDPKNKEVVSEFIVSTMEGQRTSTWPSPQARSHSREKTYTSSWSTRPSTRATSSWCKNERQETGRARRRHKPLPRSAIGQRRAIRSRHRLHA